VPAERALPAQAGDTVKGGVGADQGAAVFHRHRRVVRVGRVLTFERLNP